MEARKFKRNEFNETLFKEIVKRNFNMYKMRSETFGDSTTGIFDGILIRRSAFISCWVSFSEDTERDEKYIMLIPGVIESSILNAFIFISYLLTGGLTLLIGYFVYRNFQADFRDEIVSVLLNYTDNARVEKNGKQRIIIV